MGAGRQPARGVTYFSMSKLMEHLSEMKSSESQIHRFTFVSMWNLFLTGFPCVSMLISVWEPTTISLEDSEAPCSHRESIPENDYILCLQIPELDPFPFFVSSILFFIAVCVHACVRVCVHVCMCLCVGGLGFPLLY